jgi:hypothetical protein
MKIQQSFMNPEIPEKKSGVVVYLDALGIKDSSSEETQQFIHNKKKFLEDADKLWKKRKKQFTSDLQFHLPEPEIATFQDSIVICWSDKEEKSNFLPTYLSAGQWLIDTMPSACKDYHMFFRGAISVGDYYFDTEKNNVTVLGNAVSDAVRYEPLANWIGVIQTGACRKKYLDFLKREERKVNPKANDEINQEMLKYYAFLFVPYHIPLKTNVDDAVSYKKYFALSWPYHACKLGISFSELTSNASESVSPEIKPKYDNANDFFEWYKKNIFPELPKS